jgi:molybdenum cofactor biosynthesis enzyme MoaA
MDDRCLTATEFTVIRERWGLSEEEMARLLELVLGRGMPLEVIRIKGGEPVVSERVSRLIRLLDSPSARSFPNLRD